MADRVWLGSVASGGDVLNTAGNWLGGVAPSAGDNWIFDHRAVRAPAQNMASLAATYGSLIVTGGYRAGGIGGAGSSLTASFSATGAKVMIGAPAGVFYLAVTTPLLLGNSAGPGRLQLTGGTITSAITKCAVVREAGATLTTWRTLAGRSQLSSGGTAPTTLVIAGGECVCYANPGTVTVKSRGVLTLEESGTVTTKLTIDPDAIVHDKGSGAMANVETFPRSKLTRAGATGDRTYTDSTIWAGSQLMLRSDGGATYINGTGSSNASTIIGESDEGLIEALGLSSLLAV